MLINTIPDDCLIYSGFIFFLIFNITSIVNVFMLSIEKKVLGKMKDEFNGVKIIEFVVLKSKMY